MLLAGECQLGSLGMAGVNASRTAKVQPWFALVEACNGAADSLAILAMQQHRWLLM